MAGDRIGKSMPTDRAIESHQSWIGYLQPDGLVVSAAALVDSQVFLDSNILPIQERFHELVEGIERGEIEVLALKDQREFLLKFLEWPQDCLFGLNKEQPIPEELTVPLPEIGETLSPDIAVKDPRAKDPLQPWMLLVQILPAGTDLDTDYKIQESPWSASVSRRFERLLRETKVPTGVMLNGTSVRIIYAPRGENSGTLTFPVAAMTEVAGRPILGALRMLLHKYRLFSAPSEARLSALLERSRAYQSTVSEKLAKQVLDSLYELIRGFQAADEKAKHDLLKDVLAKNPNDVYGGILTILLRLVFLFYAEDRGLMPGSSLYVRNYSIHGLFERLRADYEKYPDTMDQRYGAWSQLIALFRAIYFGSRYHQMSMPARKGFLFDPDRYQFLEGGKDELHSIPLVSDGIVFRVLRNLLILDGERLSYRTLDVEQIGSVYETMVGFKVEIAEGRTIALKPAKSRGASAAINLESLLAQTNDNRLKWLREKTDHKLTGDAVEALKAATSIDALLEALERKIARNITAGPLAKGALVLQPTDERRRSGSHYTPRSLTEPIVRKTLEPILKRLGKNPTPQQILDLKICDIAVGSGAFLVEGSRQLGDELVKAWHFHKQVPSIPPDEDEVLHARRLVAQRCLYGVDRNPMAVDLTKLSLWLATLAKDHPFTFLDHAIRCGDSLVGLTRKQLADFHWHDEQNRVLGQDEVEEKITKAAKFRKEILEADEFVPPELKRQKLDLADESLNFVRLAGDCVVAAFFNADNDRERLAKRNAYRDQFLEFFRTFDASKNVQPIINALHNGEHPILPFHWEIEFPEVFARENGGFDGIVGNPPFAGKNTLVNSNRKGYLDWLKVLHHETHGNSDLVAHFYRRAFSLLRAQECQGLIATKTIRQGDTRTSGLRIILKEDGQIYHAVKRFKWIGAAAVTVSIIHISKKYPIEKCYLDGKEVDRISAFLFYSGGDENPISLKENSNLSFQGPIAFGTGFLFDDGNTDSNSIEAMHQLIQKNNKYSEVIFPYMGGDEMLNDPHIMHSRYAIDFGDMSEDDAKKYIDLYNIIKEKVKPMRLAQNREIRARYWWRWGETAPALKHLLADK